MALQEIGPRFTLKLRSLRKGLPAVQNFGEAPKPVELEVGTQAEEEEEARQEAEAKPVGEGSLEPNEETDVDAEGNESTPKKVVKPPTQDEFLWVWKVSILPDGLGLVFEKELIVLPLLSPSWKQLEELSSCRFLKLTVFYMYSTVCSNVTRRRGKNSTYHQLHRNNFK